MKRQWRFRVIESAGLVFAYFWYNANVHCGGGKNTFIATRCAQPFFREAALRGVALIFNEH